MRVWRIAGRRRTALDGAGARRAGGRWNSKGVAMVYASGTLSLAVLEKLVHVDPDIMPVGQMVLEIEIPDGLVTVVARRSLPRGWRRSPPIGATQRVGDQWVAAGTSPALAIPSAIVPTELNYLINPLHPDAARIKVMHRRSFAFDPRLVR
jgi:RES domain-containing protein